MQENTTVSSIGSAYTLLQDFIDVTWNADDVWHLGFSTSVSSANALTILRRGGSDSFLLSPVQGGSFFSLKIRDFFSFYFSLPFLRFFRAGLMLAVRFLGNRGGVDGLSASAAPSEKKNEQAGWDLY